MNFSTLKGNILAILSIALWGLCFPVTELLLEHWHPILLTAARLLSGSICVLIILLLTRRLHELREVPWGSAWFIGAVGVGAGTILLIWGQDLSNPVTAAILTTTLPIISLVLGLRARNEKFNMWLLTGIFLSIAGGILASPAFTEKNVPFDGGEFLVFSATILYAWYSRCCVFKLSHLSGFTTTCVTLGTGGITALAIGLGSIALGLTPQTFDLSTRSLVLIIILGTGGVGLSTALWIIATRRIGVTLAAFYVNLSPFFVMISSIVIGGKLVLVQFLAALIVVTAALIAQYPKLGKKSIET
tara:strand:+ start:456 stop:1361 length:906 start_codon:yes stop_codon:yes gene_type:complete